jgi:hypothetical protein
MVTRAFTNLKITAILTSRNYISRGVTEMNQPQRGINLAFLQQYLKFPQPSTLFLFTQKITS